jgi:hypothetical protein
MERNEMGGACKVYGMGEVNTEFRWGNLGKETTVETQALMG